MPKRRQTRQIYHLYCLSINPEKSVIFTKLYKAAPGDTNLLFSPSTEIFSQYESEENDNDDEIEEVTERLGELGFGDLLGLMEALINQAKHRRG